MHFFDETFPLSKLSELPIDSQINRAPVLLRVRAQALAVFAHEQPAETHYARSAAKNQSRPSISGREVGANW